MPLKVFEKTLTKFLKFIFLYKTFDLLHNLLPFMNILKYHVNSKHIYLGLTALLIVISTSIYFQLKKVDLSTSGDT